jgi:SAM-dependent methyltransferase
VDYLGIDIDETEIEIARKQHPQLSFQAGSAYELPVESNSFDLVIACEVLEHLEDPAKALAEIDRVANRWVLVSVPWEPTWRILNVIRGKYWRSFGNTPGHVQHFSRRDFVALLSSRFEIVAIKTPMPWSMALCRKR